MRQETIPYFDISTPYDIAYRCDSSQNPVGPHIHNATELYLTKTCLPDVLLEDKVSRVPAGSLILIPPFCVHQLYHATNVIYERYILSIHSTWLENVIFDHKNHFSYLRPQAEPMILPLEEDAIARLTELFRQALPYPCGTSPDAVCRLLLILQELDQIIGRKRPVHSVDHPCTISASQQHVNEMIAYINAHLGEPLTVKDIANHFYLHTDYLSRLFKQHTHTTVGHYIALRKITRAQAMLRDGLSISKIQEALGYSSYAHFAKAFRKLTGITPGQYRNTK